jgi:hypothetical protein
MSIDFSGTNHNETCTHTFEGRTFTYFASIRIYSENENEEEPSLNLSSANGRALLEFLGLEPGDGPCGEVSLPEMRRAIFRAVNTFDRSVKGHTRESTVEYGAPRVNDDGTVELRPARFIECGLDESYFAQRLSQLATLVETYAAHGATHINWG